MNLTCSECGKRYRRRFGRARRHLARRHPGLPAHLVVEGSWPVIKFWPMEAPPLEGVRFPPAPPHPPAGWPADDQIHD